MAASPTPTQLIAQYEGFLASPKYDTNAYRMGYGSDTVTAPDGTVTAVSPGMTTTPAQAQVDLDRRVSTQVVPGIISEIGQSAWDALSPEAQAAAASVAYNYGSLAGLPTLRAALQGGDPATIANAISARGVDNGGENAWRRTSEAQLVLSGAGLVPPMNIPEVGSAYADTSLPVDTSAIDWSVPGNELSPAALDGGAQLTSPLDSIVNGSGNPWASLPMAAAASNGPQLTSSLDPMVQGNDTGAPWAALPNPAAGTPYAWPSASLPMAAAAGGTSAPVPLAPQQPFSIPAFNPFTSGDELALDPVAANVANLASPAYAGPDFDAGYNSATGMVQPFATPGGLAAMGGTTGSAALDALMLPMAAAATTPSASDATDWASVPYDYSTAATLPMAMAASAAPALPMAAAATTPASDDDAAPVPMDRLYDTPSEANAYTLSSVDGLLAGSKVNLSALSSDQQQALIGAVPTIASMENNPSGLLKYLQANNLYGDLTQVVPTQQSNPLEQMMGVPATIPTDPSTWGLSQSLDQTGQAISDILSAAPDQFRRPLSDTDGVEPDDTGSDASMLPMASAASGDMPDVSSYAGDGGGLGSAAAAAATAFATAANDANGGGSGYSLPMAQAASSGVMSVPYDTAADPASYGVTNLPDPYAEPNGGVSADQLAGMSSPAAAVPQYINVQEQVQVPGADPAGDSSSGVSWNGNGFVMGGAPAAAVAPTYRTITVQRPNPAYQTPPVALPMAAAASMPMTPVDALQVANPGMSPSVAYSTLAAQTLASQNQVSGVPAPTTQTTPAPVIGAAAHEIQSGGNSFGGAAPGGLGGN